MKIMHVEAQVGRVEQAPSEVLVLLHLEGEPSLKQEAAAIDKQLNGQVADLLRRGEFEGRAGEALLVHTQGKAPAKRLLLVGLGKRKELQLDAFRQAFFTAVLWVSHA